MIDITQDGYTLSLVRDTAAQMNEFALKMNRPSTIYKPALSIDGNQWCALYGDSLHDGVAGFGDTPELAYQDFDKNWNLPLPKIKEA